MEHVWDDRHQLFFSELVMRFNEEEIKYFILRNYEELPEKNQGKDVDIIIEPGAYKQVSELILSVMKKYVVPYYTVTQFDRMRCWYIMNPTNNFGIHIDIIENYYCKGFELIDFYELYRNTIPYKNFRVLNESYDSLMLLLPNIIGYKSLKEKYRATISSDYDQKKEKIVPLLHKVLGKQDGEWVASKLKKKDYNAIVGESSRLSHSMKKRVLFKNVFKGIYNYSRYFILRAYRVGVCPRKYQRTIAFLGPDGSGKSTFIDGLIARLCTLYVSDNERFRVYHHRPSLLPNLGEVGEKAGIVKQDKDFTNPHRGEKTGLISSLLRMTYYWFDYLIGVSYYLRRDVNGEKYSLFDRYIYDFLVDPRRSRIYLPYWLRKCFTKMVIQPQIVFVLTTNAETIFKRKQELTMEEIKRQLNEFDKLIESHPRFVRIDAGQLPEKMIDDAIIVILNHFLQKVQ